MRVFMSVEGKFYKAEVRAATGDMEKGCVSTEGMEVLPTDPNNGLTQEQWDAAITDLVNKRSG